MRAILESWGASTPACTWGVGGGLVTFSRERKSEITGMYAGSCFLMFVSVGRIFVNTFYTWFVAKPPAPRTCFRSLASLHS